MAQVQVVVKVIGRNEKTRVKTAKGRPMGSKMWLERQLNDPFVRQAKLEGYRSRSVYKLQEINEKIGLLKKGMKVIDLGAAPGGWSQYAAKLGCEVTAIDLHEMAPIKNVRVVKGDFLDDSTLPEIAGQYDLVMSDMAAAASGQPNTDHLRVMELVEAALDFALKNTRRGGVFLTKILQGGEEQGFAKELRRHYAKVKFIKPAASRKDSSETFIIATDFKN